MPGKNLRGSSDQDIGRAHLLPSVHKQLESLESIVESEKSAIQASVLELETVDSQENETGTKEKETGKNKKFKPLMKSSSASGSHGSSASTSLSPTPARARHKFTTFDHRVKFTNVGSYPYPGIENGYGIAVVVPGYFIFVADGDNVLSFDASNKSNIRLLDSISMPGIARDISVSMPTAAAAFHSFGLRIFDVSNPSNFIHLAQVNPPPGALTLKAMIVGTKVYTLESGYGFRIFTIATPSSPSVLGGFVTSVNVFSGMAISGNTFILAPGYSYLQAFDVTNPASIVLRSTHSTGGPTSGVALNLLNKVYAVAGNTLEVLDYTVITSPNLIARVNTTSDYMGLAINRASSLSFLIDYLSGIEIFDHKNSTLPRLAGRFEMPNIVDIEPLEEYIYLSGQQGLFILKREKILPKMISKYQTSGGARDVVLDVQDDKTAYIIDEQTSGGSTGNNIFRVVDLTMLGIPSAKGSLTIPKLLSITPDINRIVFGAAMENGVPIINASNPDALIEINRYDTPGIAWKVAVKPNSNSLYIADYYSLIIMNKFNLTNPTVKGNYTTSPNTVLEVKLDETRAIAYLGVSNGVRFLNTTNEASPTSISSVVLNTYCYEIDVKVINNLSILLCANHVYGLQVIDFTIIGSPTVLNNYYGGGVSLGVKFSKVLEDKTAYLGAYQGGFLILDLSSPSALDLMGRFDIQGGVYTFVIKDGKAYIAHTSQGLVVLTDITPSLHSIINNPKLVIHKGQSLIMNPTDNFSVLDPDTSLQNIKYILSEVLAGYFDLTTDPLVPVTQIRAVDVINLLLRFTHDGSDKAPSMQITADDGLGPVEPRTNVDVTFITTPPSLVANGFTIMQGDAGLQSTPQIITTSDIRAVNGAGIVDPEIEFILDTPPQHGQFELSSNPGIPILSWKQKDVMDNKLRFRHDGSENTPSYSLKVKIVNFESSYQPGNVTYINREQDPYFVSPPQLDIPEGGDVEITTANINPGDPDGNIPSIKISLISPQHLWAFSLAQNKTVSNFFQYNITSAHIHFILDGSESDPSVSLGLEDFTGRSSPIVPMIIRKTPVNDRPELILSNPIVLTENKEEFILITSSILDSYDPDSPVLTYSVDSVTHAHVAYTYDLETEILQFPKIDVTNRLVAFVHDKSYFAPSITVSVSDGPLSSLPRPIPIQFTPVPHLHRYYFNVTEGGTILVSDQQLNATRAGYRLGTLRFSIFNRQFCKFVFNPNSAQAQDIFVQQMSMDNSLFLKNEGEEGKPSFEISVDDSVNSTPRIPAVIEWNPVDDLPQLTGFEFSLTERGSVDIGRSNFIGFNDPDTPSDQIIVKFNPVHCFVKIKATGEIILQCTFEDIEKSRIKIEHDKTEGKPSLKIILSDGPGRETSPLNATITYTKIQDLPVIDWFRIERFIEGNSVALNSSYVHASDPNGEVPDDAIELLFEDVEEASLVHPDQTPVVGYQSQAAVHSGAVVIKHNGGERPPKVSVKARAAGLESAKKPLEITEWAPVDDLPQLTSFEFSLTERGSVDIGRSNFIGFNDPDTPSAQIIVKFDPDHCFVKIKATGEIILQCTFEDIEKSRIKIEHDKTEGKPSLKIILSDGPGRETSPLNATITYTKIQDLPVIDWFRIERFIEGNSVALNSSYVHASDPNMDVPDGLIELMFEDVEEASLVHPDQTPVVGYQSQAAVHNGAVVIKHNGGERPPKVSVKARAAGLESAKKPLEITEWVPVNDRPVLRGLRFALKEKGYVDLKPSDFDFGDPDSPSSAIKIKFKALLNCRVRNLQLGEIVTECTLQELAFNNGRNIRVEHDGSQKKSSLKISMEDEDGIETPDIDAIVDFEFVNDPPVIEVFNFAIEEGEEIEFLGQEYLRISDPDLGTNLDTLQVIFDTKYAELLTAAGLRVEGYQPQKTIWDKVYRLKHDGSQNKPVVTARATDGALESLPKTADVNFTLVNDPPVVTRAGLTVEQHKTSLVTKDNIWGVDEETPEEELLVRIFELDPETGKFVFLGDPEKIISEYRQGWSKSGFMNFVPKGDKAPEMYISIFDGQLSSPMQKVLIDYRPDLASLQSSEDFASQATNRIALGAIAGGLGLAFLLLQLYLKRRFDNEEERILKEHARQHRGEWGNYYDSHFEPVYRMMMSKISTKNICRVRSDTEGYITAAEDIWKDIGSQNDDYTIGKFVRSVDREQLAKSIVHQIHLLVAQGRAKCCSCRGICQRCRVKVSADLLKNNVRPIAEAVLQDLLAKCPMNDQASPRKSGQNSQAIPGEVEMSVMPVSVRRSVTSESAPLLSQFQHEVQSEIDALKNHTGLRTPSPWTAAPSRAALHRSVLEGHDDGDVKSPETALESAEAVETEASVPMPPLVPGYQSQVEGGADSEAAALSPRAVDVGAVLVEEGAERSIASPAGGGKRRSTKVKRS